MASIIDNALSAVMSVRTDPSSTLAAASESFRTSANVAGIIKDSLERVAVRKYKEQEQAYQNQVALLQREEEMKFKVQLQEAGFAQQSALANQKYYNSVSLAGIDNTAANIRTQTAANASMNVAKANALAKVAAADIENSKKNLKELRNMLGK